MIVPSHTYERSITISVYSPLILGAYFVQLLDNEIEGYTHTIAADGGFLSCEITLRTSESYADDWITNGMGRHVSVHGTAGEIVWEGYVDNISIDMGNINIERGKLSEICNRCCVSYTPIEDYDNETGEPVTGDQMDTLIVEDAESISKYGIWERIVAGGTLDQEERGEADALRDAYLEDNKWPQVSHRPTIGVEAGANITLVLSCKGYYEWLNNYIYEFGEDDLSTDVTDKIIDVLAADPNGVFSTDITDIDYNGTLINSYEQTNRIAMAVITEAVSLGDVNGNRWLFGIWENRRAKYKAIPSSIEYIHYIGDGAQRVLNLDGTPVNSWNVRPGKFVRMPDMLIGRLPMYSGYGLRYDKHVMFIEQVMFKAPNTVELQGKKVLNIDQYLARLGV